MDESSFSISSNETYDNLILYDSNDPDINLFNSLSLETNFLSTIEAKQQMPKFNANKFSILNLNIRSMGKNFDNFKNFLYQLNFDCYLYIRNLVQR